MGDGLSEIFEDTEFGHTNLTGAASPEDLFSILESLEDAAKEVPPAFNVHPLEEPVFSPRGGDHDSTTRLVSQGSASSSIRAHEINEGDHDEETNHARKKLKSSTLAAALFDAAAQDGQHKISHITVERNRRKQMNEHLSVLRSLMPCFYVKRGDQASIIGGVVDYIKELQQVLQSLEAKKQRKVYSEVLSPRPISSSPRTTPLSPRPPPLSPRMGLPVSPRTPQPGSPYKPRILQQSYRSPTTLVPSHESSPSIENNVSDLVANSKSPVADVEVKFSGPNVLLKTVSHRIPSQSLKIITALEGLSLEILHASISTIDDTMLNSFTIKVTTTPLNPMFPFLSS